MVERDMGGNKSNCIAELCDLIFLFNNANVKKKMPREKSRESLNIALQIKSRDGDFKFTSYLVTSTSARSVASFDVEKMG